ncbi:filamentous hemagglutinin N-terminal domain-containing protein, partial [Polaromonas sp.]
MTRPFAKHGAYRPWTVRTVVVRLSRKLTATYRLHSGRVLSRLLAAMLAGFSTLATALPEGASLVAGQANISTPSANAMVVTQGSDKAILNWQSFNIDTGQSMQFVQPGAASVALNRVVGAAPSSIYGSLSANGQVFLINPAGVMFAPGAQVHVGGLVASTLALSNEDFMAGRYTFSSNGNAGTVTNGGNIRAARGGYVLLAAPGVSNSGSINADAGSVGLVAGARVSVDTSGAGLVSFSVDAAAANAVAANSGVITAQGGQVAVLASALGDVMATVINQTGVIRATSATERNGVIVLSGGKTGVVAVSGELNASGADGGKTGGTVKVLGDKVVLAAGARIDASGQVGGGTVLIGGNYQGKGVEQNASLTLVARDVVIVASAAGSGDGGKVVVWSDAATGFYGAIKATGGSDSGHGGFAEVSGKQTLAFDGSVNLGAARGEAGTLLLDPLNIIVSNAGPATYADVSTFAAQSGTTQTVSVATLNAVAGNITLQAGNDITLSNALAVTGSRSISLEANNNINVNAALSVTGAGAINLKADADNSGAGTLALGAALSSQAGGITLSGASVTSTAAGSTTTTGAANADAGQLSITSAGVVNLAGAITATGGTASAGNVGRAGGAVNITGVGGVTTAGISASGSTGNGAGQSGGNAGSLTVSNTVAGAVSVGTLTAQTGAGVGTGAGGVAGSINVSNTAGNVTAGVITTSGGANGNGGAVSVTATGTLSTSTIASTGGTAQAGTAGRTAGTVTLQAG